MQGRLEVHFLTATPTTEAMRACQASFVDLNRSEIRCRHPGYELPYDPRVMGKVEKGGVDVFRLDRIDRTGMAGLISSGPDFVDQ
jgi:hypothetical protein